MKFELRNETAKLISRAVSDFDLGSHRTGFLLMLRPDGKHSFCEYDAPDEDAVREHSRKSGIPFDRIQPLGLELGPSWT